MSLYCHSQVFSGCALQNLVRNRSSRYYLSFINTMNLDSFFHLLYRELWDYGCSLNLCLEWNINLPNILQYVLYCAWCFLIQRVLSNYPHGNSCYFTCPIQFCAKIVTVVFIFCFIATRCISATCWPGGHLALTYKKKRKLKIQIKLSHNALWGTVVLASNLICISSWKKCNNILRLLCRSWVFL